MFLEELKRADLRYYFMYRIKKQWYMPSLKKKKKNQEVEVTDLLWTTRHYSSPVLFQVCLSVRKFGLKVGFVFCRSNKCFWFQRWVDDRGGNYSNPLSVRERERETTTLHGLMLFSAVDWIIYSQNMILNLLLWFMVSIRRNAFLGTSSAEEQTC